MSSANEVIVLESQQIQENEKSMFLNCVNSIREDLKTDPYIEEAIRVLQVQGYRSSIGSIWNAVIDDLRKKVIHRSLDMFNKEITPRREVKNYEDFQDNINDDELIEGAYKIGVIGWEARKVLKHAKETRHIFDGHPKSSNPSAIKVLGMFEDCIKYVLSQEYPTPIINIDEYMSVLGTQEFDRNLYAVENALSDLPERYKTELINRLFSAYINESCSSVLRSNIEFTVPVLWSYLLRDTHIQIIRRIDREIINGNSVITDFCFDFVRLVDGMKYLSTNARKYKVKPLIEELLVSLDEWSKENRIVNELEKYAGYIPNDLLKDYIWGLTQTYVGYIGSSASFSRKDFYADGVSSVIPNMFEKFDDNSADLFLEVIRDNDMLRSRLRSSIKMNRLKLLGDRIINKLSSKYGNKHIFEALLDEKREKEFFSLVDKL